MPLSGMVATPRLSSTDLGTFRFRPVESAISWASAEDLGSGALKASPMREDPSETLER